MKKQTKGEGLIFPWGALVAACVVCFPSQLFCLLSEKRRYMHSKLVLNFALAAVFWASVVYCV